MPWKECSVMEERLQFVARWLAGEPMSELCQEFGISRKTGYKIFDRYQACGVQGLTDRSRRPHHYAHKLPFQVENYILNLNREYPQLGCSQNSRAPDPTIFRHKNPSQEHRPRAARSPRLCRASWPRQAPCTRNSAVGRSMSQ
jgi:hypothetical protein